jgi:small conductance mechanosensitive channel
MEQQATVVNNYLDKIIDFGFEYAPKLIGGILVLFIGLWVTNLITKAVGKSLQSRTLISLLSHF